MTAATMIDIVVNGEHKSIAAGASLAELLDQLGLDARAVVVEHNRLIVRRPQLGLVTLGPGDVVELVHFVGGG